MKNQIKKFVHSQFGEVRTIIDDEGKPWFVGKDVTKLLGYKNASKAIDDHVHKDDKLNNESLSSLGQRGGWLINEYGLYDLAFASKLPQAQAFKRWVITEVLPQIRKTGGYIPTHAADGDLLSPDEIIEQAKKIVQNTLDYQTKQLEEMEQKLIEQKPKVQFAEAVEENENSIYIRELAKLLTNNGIKISQNQLFAWLRNNGYLYQRSTLPIQKWVVKGYFSVHVTLYEDSRGRLYENVVTKVTGLGQLYFINLFINKNL